MRRTLIILFTVILVVLACSLVSCGNGTDKGAETTRTETTRTESAGLEFVSNGDGTCSVSGIGDCTDADVVIPLRSSAGESVTGIKERAFKDCKTVTSVFIPESVKTVGRFAFYNCTALTSAVISDGVETIGEDAFHGCSTLASVSLGEGVTGLSENCFYNCAALTSFTVPAGVKSVGTATFFGCSGLASVTIPDTVTSIGDRAFSGCASLPSVVVPDSVKSIGSGAFAGCAGLESITLPFLGAKEESTVPGEDVFVYIFGSQKYDGGTKVESWYTDSSGYARNSSHYVPSLLKKITVTGGEIVADAFWNCAGLTEINLPDGIETIGEYAFAGCTGLRTIRLPETVTTIERYAFAGCSELQTVVLPETLERIYAYAFENCEKLNLTLPAGIMLVGLGAFAGCNSLSSTIVVGKYLSLIEPKAFGRLPQLTGFVVDDKNVRYFSDGNCLIEMETGILVAGSSTGTIPTDGSVIAIGDCAFEGFVGLTSITIPNGVMRIGFGAFVDCEALASITIPASVTTIGPWVFVGCSALTSIHYQGTVEQWEAIDKGDWWDHQTGDYTVYCTDGNLSK